MIMYCSVVFFFFFSSRRRHTRCALVTGVQTCALPICKPGGQRRASLEPFDRGKSAQICALHRILGFRAIAEDGEGGSKQALVVARGNVPHRSRIARGDKRRQSCVIQRTVVVIAMYHGDHSYSPVLARHWMPGAGRRFPTNMIMVP